MNLKKTWFLIVIFTVFFVSKAAIGQSVQPFVFDLAPSGAKASTAITVDNTQQEAVTFEVSVLKVNLDKYGKESLVPADDDFLIFPPQAMVQPGKLQKIRVKYVGDPAIENSQAYRLAIKQIPVNFSGEGESAIGLAVNFYTFTTVVPQGAKAKPVVEFLKTASNGSWKLSVKNEGSHVYKLTNSEWKLKDSATGNEKILDKKEAESFFGAHIILPKSKIELNIPAIKGFNPSTTVLSVK